MQEQELIINAVKQFKHDYIRLYVKGNKLHISTCTDNTGNEFSISLAKLKRLIKDGY